MQRPWGYSKNMSTTTEKLVKEALALPPAQRAFMAEKLIESLDIDDATPLSDAWQKELRRRCDEVERGEVELLEAQTVFARAYASLQ